MTERVRVSEPVERSRAEVRRWLREGFDDLGEPVRVLAEDVLGAGDERIDWIAVLRSGRAVVGLLATERPPPGFLESGLVQRAWVGARLRDWQKLAPGLDVRADLRPVLLLLAPELPPSLEVAAREADASTLWIVRYAFERRGTSVRAVLRRERGADTPAPEPAAEIPSGDRPLRSLFRTGLSDEDLSPPAA